jgi:glycosyltransferase involved in cell wall biosynthesis
MRVDLVDPPAYSPPYDDALARALASRGAEVRLVTSEFAYGAAPVAGEGASAYRRDELFYGHATGGAGSRLRAVSKRAEHIPDMLRYRRNAARNADISHFEWLTVPRVDLRLLPDGPTVLTIHDPLERGGRRPPLPAGAFARVDAVVVHSEYAREQVRAQHGLEPERVHVIRHGALGPFRGPARGDKPGEGTGFVPAAAARGEKATPTVGFLPRDAPDGSEHAADLADNGSPVVLCFGLLRPYKGIETLLKAWGGISGAQLWIVGRPMMDLAPLQAAAPPGVQFLPRFVTAQEEDVLFTRADIVVLPYERSDRFGFSGVLATALGYGKAIVLSDVGGLSEVAADPANPAARLVPPGDPDELHTAFAELLGDDAARAHLATAAAHAAATTYSWDTAARETLALYAKILGA